MGLSISEIRKNTTRARHLMQRTRAQRFAVGAFNIDNQETLIAVARAAQTLQSPVLVEVSDAEVKAMGLENVRDLVDNYKAEYGIEMYLNLDHGPTVEGCKRAIDAGYEFVHIDISQANHNASDEEIIAKTREVVEYAYDLEYGSNKLCLHKDAIKPGQKVLVVDDLLATGGTVEATIKLVEELGGVVAGLAFLIELIDLKGRDKLNNYPMITLMQY